MFSIFLNKLRTILRSYIYMEACISLFLRVGCARYVSPGY